MNNTISVRNKILDKLIFSGPLLLCLSFSVVLIKFASQLSEENGLWKIECLISLGLGLFICTFSHREQSLQFSNLLEIAEEEKQIQLARLIAVEQELEKQKQITAREKQTHRERITAVEEELEKQKAIAENENSLLKKSLAEHAALLIAAENKGAGHIQQLLEQIAEKEKDLSGHQERIRFAEKEFEKQISFYQQEKESWQQVLEQTRKQASEFLSELNEIRVSHYQLSLLISQPKIQEKKQTVEHHYKQLREQFDEKSAVLDETRRQLFFVENQLLALQKAQEEQAVEENPELRSLFSYISALEKDRLDQELEIDALQSLLASEKPKPRVRKKKAVAKEEAPDLFARI